MERNPSGGSFTRKGYATALSGKAAKSCPVVFNHKFSELPTGSENLFRLSNGQKVFFDSLTRPSGRVLRLAGGDFPPDRLHMAAFRMRSRAWFTAGIFSTATVTAPSASR